MRTSFVPRRRHLAAMLVTVVALAACASPDTGTSSRVLPTATSVAPRVEAAPRLLRPADLSGRYESQINAGKRSLAISLSCENERCVLNSLGDAVGGQLLPPTFAVPATRAGVGRAFERLQQRRGAPASNPRYQSLRAQADAVLAAESRLEACGDVMPRDVGTQVLCTVSGAANGQRAVLLFQSSMGPCDLDYCEYLVIPLVQR